MLFWNISGKSGIGWPYPWILGAVLGLMVGPASGQEGWGSFSQPDVAARAAVLMNADTGEILFAKEPHLRLPPASTTKVLTALLTMERLDPNSRVQASPQAASTAPSRIGLRAGETASTQDLLYGLLLKSGNDAAETLAEAAGGSVYGFADLMNAKAWQIGARDSHFMNPHGLPDEEHYSTAYDMALIFRHAMNYAMFSDIVRTRSATLRIDSGQGPYGDSRLVQVVNHNRLLSSYEGTRGGKTGFTLKARRCFVGEVDRGGTRLIVSIMNSPNSGTLWQDARTLLDYGFARSGVGTPPPIMQPDFEPRPILVRNTPTTSKTPDYLVWSRPAGEDEDLEPPASIQRKPAPARMASRPTPVQDNDFEPVATSPKPAPVRVTSRPAPVQDDDLEPVATSPKPAPAQSLAGPIVDQPAVVSGSLARVLARRKTLAEFSAEPVPAPARAKATPNTTPPQKVVMASAKTKPAALASAKTKPATLASAKAKPATLASAKAKPATLASAKTKPAAGSLPNAKADKPVAVAAIKPDKRSASRVIARAEPTVSKLPQKSPKRRI